MGWPIVRLDLLQEPCQIRHRVVALDQRSMATDTLERDSKVAHLFLGHHYGVEPLPPQVETEPTAFAYRVSDPLEELRMLLHQIAGAVVSARLLVTDQGEHDVAGGSNSSALARMMAWSIMAMPPFMSSEPRPQSTPSTMSPPNGGCCQRDGSADTTSTWPWSSKGAALPSPGDEVGPAGCFGQDLVLDACAVQQRFYVGDALGFIARRVCGIETHQPLR